MQCSCLCFSRSFAEAKGLFLRLTLDKTTAKPYIMDDGKFQWDDGKAAKNFAKHAITFEMAREVFDDVFAIEWPDDHQDAGEQRFAVLGVVEGRILFVVYTMRDEIIRIISARRAESFERRRYHDENQT